MSTEGSNAEAVWSPDGRYVAFGSSRDSGNGIFVRAADGSEAERRVTQTRVFQIPTAWSPDGRQIALTETGDNEDALIVAADGAREPEPFAVGPANQQSGSISPDGRWMAYASDASGDMQILVGAFPSGGSVVQVSSKPSFMPSWSKDGKEIFFLSGPRGEIMMAAQVTTDPELSISPPRRLFEHKFGGSIGMGLRRYDVASDGSHFFFPTDEGGDAARQINIALDWLSEVRRLMGDG